jgi:hypothetical protein
MLIPRVQRKKENIPPIIMIQLRGVDDGRGQRRQRKDFSGLKLSQQRISSQSGAISRAQGLIFS